MHCTAHQAYVWIVRRATQIQILRTEFGTGSYSPITTSASAFFTIHYSLFPTTHNGPGGPSSVTEDRVKPQNFMGALAPKVRWLPTKNDLVE